jgi:hypothetical protein
MRSTARPSGIVPNLSLVTRDATAMVNLFHVVLQASVLISANQIGLPYPIR